MLAQFIMQFSQYLRSYAMPEALAIHSRGGEPSLPTSQPCMRHLLVS